MEFLAARIAKRSAVLFDDIEASVFFIGHSGDLSTLGSWLSSSLHVEMLLMITLVVIKAF